MLRVLGAVATAGFLVSLYFLLAPDQPLHRELVAATDHSPPFQIVYPDGRIGGAVVEAINLAATRAGIKIKWKYMEVRPDDVLRDLDSGVDLWPMVTSTPERRTQFHHTQPIGRAEYLIAAIDDGRINLRDFRPARVAITSGPWIRERLRADFPTSTAVVVRSGQQLTEVCDGRADAMIADAASLYAMTMNQPAGCAGKKLTNRLLVNWYWDLAIGSTFARAEEADRIRAEFGHLARSGALHEVFADYPIQAQYRSHDTFAETRTERDARHSRLTLLGLCVCCLALLGIVAETRRRTSQAMRLVKLKSEFLDRISHELRTPLNGVLGLASLLATTPLSAEQRDYLRLIRQSGEELLKLVTDSLALSRLTAQKRDAQTQVFCPRKLVEDTVAVLAPLALDKNLDFVWVVERGVPRCVRGDEGAVRQLLINLTGNALKYSDRGTVRLRMQLIGAESTYPFLRCEVDDSGPGIPKEDRARIFESFVRLNRPQDQHAVGTGLGLAIARELVFLLNGNIGVDSSPYGGAKFWFEFPVEAATFGEHCETRGIPAQWMAAEDDSTPDPANAHGSSKAAQVVASEVPAPEDSATENSTLFRPSHAHLVWAFDHETFAGSTSGNAAMALVCESGETSAEHCSGCVGQHGQHFGKDDETVATNLQQLVRATAASTGFHPPPNDGGTPSNQPHNGDHLPESLEMLAQYFELENVTVTISLGAKEALRRARQQRAVDLLVVEGPRPGRSLQRIVSSMREAYGNAKLPVVAFCPAMAGSGTCSTRRPALLRVLRRPFLSTRFSDALAELNHEQSSAVPSSSEERLALYPIHSSDGERCPAASNGSSRSVSAPASENPLAGLSSLLEAHPKSMDGCNPPTRKPESDTKLTSTSTRALVADDNPVNRLVLMSMLRAFGVVSDGVGDGHQALAACERISYDVVILDHHMPNLDGPDTARALRACADWRSTVPVIACSAADLATNEQRYRDAGVNAVLPKPFTLQQLRAILQGSVPLLSTMPALEDTHQSAPIP